jgi:O-antigen/teichoic acid export membrane protein
MLSTCVATSRYRRIVKAVSSGAAARLLSAGITLVSLPLAVRYLGAERYGVWATITTTVVWINLLDLGIANTLTNSISRAYALDDKTSATRYFTNALLITGSIAAVVGAAFAVVGYRVNWMKLFNVSANVPAAEVRNTVVTAVALMLLGLPCNLGAKLLAGYQELHRNNYAVCAGAMASVVGLALGIVLHVSMPVLFMMSVGCLTFANLANLLLVVTWNKPWLLPRPRLIDSSTSKELFNSGSSFFFIQVAAVVVFSSDNVVVSHYLGAAEVTPYSVTWRLVGLAAVLQSLIFPALWPAYAEAYARHDYVWIRRTFSLTMKGTVALNLCCVAMLVVFGRALIRVWAGPAAVPAFSLLLAMGVWVLIGGFMSVESCLLAALNRTRGQAVLSTLAAIVNVALSIVLVRQIGSLGVIGGTILSYLVVLVIPQSLIVRSLFKGELATTGEGRFAVRGSLFAKAKFLYSATKVQDPDVANFGRRG